MRENVATVGPEFNVELPSTVRSLLGVHPGDQIAFYVIDGELIVIRSKTAQELRGSLAQYPELDDLEALRDRSDEVL